MSSKVNFKWTEIGQYALDEIKLIVVNSTLITYPYLKEILKIHTNARIFQLGASIRQKGRPIAFYSRLLTDIKRRYIVTEKGLISIFKF